jgi:hypothetical protein
VGQYNNFIGYGKGVPCHQKTEENIDFEWGPWTRGAKKRGINRFIMYYKRQKNPEADKG